MRDGHRPECKACNLARAAGVVPRRIREPAIERVAALAAREPRARTARRSASTPTSGKKADLGSQEPPEAEVRASRSRSSTRCSRRRAACARSAVKPRPEERTLHVDHDHATGAIRGLLCFRCNNALGDFREDVELVPAGGGLPRSGRRAGGARAGAGGCAERLSAGGRLPRRCPNPARCRCSPRRRSRAVVRRPAPPTSRRTSSRAPGSSTPSPLDIPHGTTVVAIRYAGGVVMAGDRRATAGYTIASRRIEKVFAGRRLLRRRDRRRGRPGGRDGASCSRSSSSTTRRCRARRSASRARPTSSASWCAPTCPPRCRASWSCRSSPATTSAAAAAGCSRYDVTGGRYEESRLPGPGLRQRPRPQLDQGRLARGHDARRRRSTSRSGRCSPPPTRTSPPAAPTSCAASSRPSPSSTPTASARSPTTTSPPAARPCCRVRERGGAES